MYINTEDTHNWRNETVYDHFILNAIYVSTCIYIYLKELDINAKSQTC